MEDRRAGATPGAVASSAALLNEFAAFTGFEEASRIALDFLHESFGFALWMVTRTEGDDWIVLTARDEAYDIDSGDVFCWTDSFCSRMVQGLGPMIAPDSTLVPVYAAAPVAAQLDIGAYVGTPICAPDGSLFGTLCAIDPHPQRAVSERDLPFVKVVTTLLATVLATELKAAEERRKAERDTLEANRDALTGVGTRRVWDTVMAAEEERCRVLGTRAAVLIVDLDELKEINDSQGHHAGDDLLVAAAGAISSSVRANDIVARVGGDEFAVLATDCTEEQTIMLCERIRRALNMAGVKSSVGYSMRAPRATIDDAWRTADRRMYREKQLRSHAA